MSVSHGNVLSLSINAILCLGSFLFPNFTLPLFPPSVSTYQFMNVNSHLLTVVSIMCLWGTFQEKTEGEQRRVYFLGITPGHEKSHSALKDFRLKWLLSFIKILFFPAGFGGVFSDYDDQGDITVSVSRRDGHKYLCF